MRSGPDRVRRTGQIPRPGSCAGNGRRVGAVARGYVAAIDQGTTSTRCIIFDHRGRIVALHQIEHRQIFPRAGWVEHDAEEIWANTREVIAAALAKADLAHT